MKSAILVAVSAVALMLPGAAFAQAAKASRSADQIVCELTGDCDKSAPDESQRIELPKEAAFSFTRPGQMKAATAVARQPQVAVARPSQPVRVTRTGRAQMASVAAVSMPVAAARAPAAAGIDMRITFGLGSAEMTSQGRAEVEAFAKALQLPALASRRFIVEGHTDASGDHDANVKLSQARADSVATYLASLGVGSERLTAKGYGPDKPLAGRASTSASNRRVQFVPAS